MNVWICGFCLDVEDGNYDDSADDDNYDDDDNDDYSGLWACGGSWESRLDGAASQSSHSHSCLALPLCPTSIPTLGGQSVTATLEF